MISRLHVRNFKSLNDVALELGPRNVLVGPNMSGKTNFISVFRFLTQLVRPVSGAFGLPSAVNAMGGFQELAWRGGHSNLISIELQGTFAAASPERNDESWAYSLDFVSDGRGHITVQEETLTFSQPGRRYAAIRKDSGSGRRLLVGRDNAHISGVPDASRSALEFEIPDWDGNKVRNLFASFRFYNLIPALMKQVNPSAAPFVLDEGGANLSSWLMTLQTRFHEAFQKINLAARGVFPDISKIFTYPTQQSTVFLASSEQHLLSPVPVWQMSDGELCLLAWLSLIYCPPDLAAPVYFVEEPENHLHPRAVEALVELLDQAQGEAGVNQAQIFATTHSLLVVDRTSVRNLIIFEKQRGATVCTRPQEKQHLQELIARSELGLGDLYYSGALGRNE